MLKLNLEKAAEPEIKLSTSIGSQKIQESSRKNIYFCTIDDAKARDCVDHDKLWKTLKELGILNHLPPEKFVCRSRSNRNRHGTMYWFQTGKEVHQDFILTPSYLTCM